MVAGNQTVANKHGHGILHYSIGLTATGAVTLVNLTVEGYLNSGGGVLGVGSADYLALHVTHLGLGPDGDIIGYGDGILILAPQLIVQTVVNLGIGCSASQGHINAIVKATGCRSEDWSLNGLLYLGEGNGHVIADLVTLGGNSGVGRGLGNIERAIVIDPIALLFFGTNPVEDRTIFGGTGQSHL